MVPNEDLTAIIVNLEFIQSQLRSLAQFGDFYSADSEHFSRVRDAVELLSARVTQWQSSPANREHVQRQRERRQHERRATERRGDDRRAHDNGAAA